VIAPAVEDVLDEELATRRLAVANAAITSSIAKPSVVSLTNN
jgi:hypothetical protein